MHDSSATCKRTCEVHLIPIVFRNAFGFVTLECLVDEDEVADIALEVFSCKDVAILYDFWAIRISGFAALFGEKICLCELILLVLLLLELYVFETARNHMDGDICIEVLRQHLCHFRLVNIRQFLVYFDYFLLNHSDFAASSSFT